MRVKKLPIRAYNSICQTAESTNESNNYTHKAAVLCV